MDNGRGSHARLKPWQGNRGIYIETMRKRFTAVLTALLILSIILSGCSEELPSNKVYSASDMPGSTVGVLSGTASAGYLEKYGSSMTVMQYDDVESMSVALKNGSLDCVVADDGTFQEMRNYVSGFKSLEEYFIDRDYCLAVSADNEELLTNLDAALETLQQNGTLDAIISGWNAGGYEWETDPATAEDGLSSISVAVDPTLSPYAFLDENGELAGAEIDIVRALCAALGLRPEFIQVASDQLIYTVESGKVALAVGRLTPTGEETGVTFTQPYTHSRQLIVVRG